MLEVQKLVKYYDTTQVLNIPALTISPGECVGLLGNNGAGKTTFFSIILDLIQPSAGFVTNQNIRADQSEDWKNFTASFIDESFLIGYLTPEEYFYFIGDLRGVNKATVDAMLTEYDDFFNGEILGRGKFLRDLSKGNQKKVGIVASLVGDPAVIIWDEPFANLDPSTQMRLKRIVSRLRESRDRTILISSHDLSHTVEVSDRVIILDKGLIVQDVQTADVTLSDLESFFMV